MINLDQFVLYLLNRAAQRSSECLESDLSTFSISVKEWRILAVLADGSSPRMSELARKTSIDRTTLTRVVARMVDKQLARRSRPVDDGREVEITASDEGLQLFPALLPRANSNERTALGGFTAEEVAVLKEMLNRMYVNLERSGGEAGHP